MPPRIAYHRAPTAPPPGSPRPSETSADRAEAHRFYCSVRWTRARARQLATQPLCEVCQAEGYVTEANTVHHRKERRDFPELALDPKNLESVCSRCHGTKRRKTGGGGIAAKPIPVPDQP